MSDHFNIKEFSYHVGWRSRGRHPGQHASTLRGMGMEFRGHSTLLAYPDPRRIDIRQTIRDPMEQVYVRIYNQKSAIPVYVVCDMSGSMNFGHGRRKLQLAAEIAESIAQSATHSSDPFGFIGFDDQVREDWISIASVKPQRAFELTERLKDYHPPQLAGNGLLDVYRYLPRERALIFLISDFHMPLSDLQESLSMLLRHHIVPMVLWDRSEYLNMPEFGITSVADSETGALRTLFMRRALKQRIIEGFEQRRADIDAMFMRFDMPPFYVENQFDADALTEYFYQFVAP